MELWSVHQAGGPSTKLSHALPSSGHDVFEYIATKTLSGLEMVVYRMGSSVSGGHKLKRVNAYDKNVKYDPTGVFAFNTGAKAVATTNIDDIGDAMFFVQFPANTYLLDLQYTWSDVDSASLFQWDGVTSTTGASGGTEVTLISNSTVGRTAGSDELDADQGHFMRDVSNLYLGFKVDAAATAVAGTLTIKGLVYIGDVVTGF